MVQRCRKGYLGSKGKSVLNNPQSPLVTGETRTEEAAGKYINHVLIGYLINTIRDKQSDRQSRGGRLEASRKATHWVT